MTRLQDELAAVLCGDAQVTRSMVNEVIPQIVETVAHRTEDTEYNALKEVLYAVCFTLGGQIQRLLSSNLDMATYEMYELLEKLDVAIGTDFCETAIGDSGEDYLDNYENWKTTHA